MALLSLGELKEKIEQFPRKKIVNLPTPLQKLERLSRFFGGPEIYMKRDDLTGLAFGGNKSRKLEYIIHDVLDKKADVIITWASIQSNWCLQTAAAARRFGIKPVLILFKTYELPDECDGNLLLDFILDAEIRIKEAEKGKVVSEEYAAEIVEGVAREMNNKGHTPYVAPIGGSMVGGSMDIPLGALSYVRAFAEMLEQTEELGVDVSHVIHATGSGGTQAGLVVGASLLTEKVKVVGISVSDEREIFSSVVRTIAQEALKAMKLDLSFQEDDIIVLDEYIKEGYGIVTHEVSEIVRLVAMKEGIFLDPVYTGKAMVALADLIKKGYFKKEDKVVFFHTGGTPALFPNKHNFEKYLKITP
ncbi:MAG: D-cysteine desulfhydrase family protein [Candidatus Aminicenantales bacterium]